MTQAEDDVGAREAWVQKEIDRRVAGSHWGLACEYAERLELV